MSFPSSQIDAEDGGCLMKDVNGRSEQKSVKDEWSASTSVIRPHIDLPFPPELFEIIGEFLAGEFKLASLACLNVANRLLHETTSLVLWTTVTLDSATPRWNDMLKRISPTNNLRDPSPARMKSLATAMETFRNRKDLQGSLPENRRHVKFLFISHECDIDEMFFPSLFPRLEVKMVIERSWCSTHSHVEIRHSEAINVKIFEPISTDCFFAHLLQTPIRRAIRQGEGNLDPPSTHLPELSSLPTGLSDSLLTLPLAVRTVFLGETAYLYDSGTLSLRARLLPDLSRRSPFQRGIHDYRLKHPTLRLKHLALVFAHTPPTHSAYPGVGSGFKW